MNEGHASLLTLELLLESAHKARRTHIDASDLAAVRQKCIFTTHTPVPGEPTWFSQISSLKKIANEFGGLQFIYAGRAHPSDAEGKNLIRRIFELKRALKGQIAIAFLSNYDVELAKLITAGVDLWVKFPATAARGLRNQRHESSIQRHPEFERVRWVVA